LRAISGEVNYRGAATIGASQPKGVRSYLGVLWGGRIGEEGAMTLHAVTLVIIVWFLMNGLFVAVRVFR
jgi:hypothetical protein